MKLSQGTISVLFGAHSPIHSALVFASWVKLYHRLPRPWELGCIILHDIGHWGKNYLDSESEKHLHWWLGAQIAGDLFGDKGFLMVAGHDPHSGWPRSLLNNPDKYSWWLAPVCWIKFNYVVEPKIRMGYSRQRAALLFKARVRDNVQSGKFGANHDFYLERCRNGRN